MSAVMAPPISIHKVWLRSAHGTSVQWRIAIRNKTDEIGDDVDIGPASSIPLGEPFCASRPGMQRWWPSLVDIHRVVELLLNC